MKKVTIKNNEEIEKWIFHHAYELNHKCDAVRGMVGKERMNIAFVDTVTKERIDFKYE